MTMQFDSKSVLLRDMDAYARELLMTYPVMKLEEFENRVRVHFARRIRELKLGRKLKSGRTEWKNLVDWVKANLSRRELTWYVTHKGHRYIVCLITVGLVYSREMAELEQAARIVTRLLDMAKFEQAARIVARLPRLVEDDSLDRDMVDAPGERIKKAPKPARIKRPLVAANGSGEA